MDRKWIWDHEFLGVWLDGWFPIFTHVFPWSLSCAGIYKEIHLIGNQWTIGLMNPVNVRILKILVWLGFLRTDMEISDELSDELGPWELNGTHQNWDSADQTSWKTYCPSCQPPIADGGRSDGSIKVPMDPRLRLSNVQRPKKHHRGLDSLHLTDIY